LRKVTILFHSGYGHTKRVAEHVQKGVASSDVTVETIAIDSEGNLPEAAWQTLQDSDAIIFGTPTYMGGPSWQFKKFADTSSKQWFAMAWKGKVAAGFTNSGSITGDKESTLHYLVTLASAAQNALEQFRLETGKHKSVDPRRHQLSRRLSRADCGFALGCLGRRNDPW
jgi:NAD(P)H dehydrogenase (quinone)